MKQGDLVRIKNTAYTHMFYPEIVGRTGMLIDHHLAESLEAVEVFEVLVAGTIMHIEPMNVEPA